jgi:hypothetical protein
MFVENIVRGEKALIVSRGGFSVNKDGGAVRQWRAVLSVRRGGVSDDECWAVRGDTAKFTESGPLGVENGPPMEEVTRRVSEECEFRSDDQISARIGGLGISVDDLITVAGNITNDGIVLRDGNLKRRSHTGRWVC